MHWFFKVLIVLGLFGFFIVFILFIRPKLLPIKQIINSEKYGIILQSERWGGVIRVTGDILVVPGARIDVDPGTQILIVTSGDKSNMDLIPLHLKSGVNAEPEDIFGVMHGEPFYDEGQKISLRFFKFYAKGTSQQPVILASDTDTKSPYDINTIWINSGILSNVKLASFRRLEIGPNVIISESSISDSGECGVCILRGKPQVLNSIFNGTLRNYIWVERASPLISGNTFLPTKGNGVVVNPKRFGSPKILNNKFQLPGYSGVYFLEGGEKKGGEITSNFFAAGDITIPCDSKVSVTQNHIKSNLRFLKSGNCVGSITIGENYWEVDSPEKIVNERVIEKELDFTVNIKEVLKSPPKNAGEK